MSPITTHVLDTSEGRPAEGVPVVLESGGRELARGRTDADGRLKNLLPDGSKLAVGDYTLTFDTQSYFSARGQTGFYPRVTVAFTIRDAGQHYHVPLLLSPYGYATYRGS